MRVVLDTNVLVSALWSKNNRLTQILSLVIRESLTPYYNAEIMREYQDVLSRPRLAFHFNEARVSEIIGKIKTDGLSIVVKPSTIPFSDGSDRFFYDVAKACKAILITGNARHFPVEPFIMTPAQFLSLVENE